MTVRESFSAACLTPDRKIKKRELAVLMPPGNEDALRMQWMEDSTLRRWWRLTHRLINVPKGRMSP
jgi:hypothetical protein